MPFLEIIVDTVEDAIAAETGGATQLALLSHYPSTGVTPSFGMVARIYEKVRIPVIVLLCPHTRGYIPSEEDLETCLRDIEVFKKIGIHDFLIGFIDQTNNLNIQAVGKIRAAHPDIHLHNRIIWEFSRDIQQTVETAIALGFLSMRTSGNHMQNIMVNGDMMETMRNIKLIKDTANKRIAVLLTGGITAANAEFIMNQSGIFDLQIGRGVRSPSNSYSPVDPQKVAILRSKQISVFEDFNLKN